jgi:Phytanoyl-CoA dioxygenase (PhyH)
VQSIVLNPKYDDQSRRRALFSGEIILYSAIGASELLCRHAKQMALDAFAPRDPEHAQEDMTVDEFVSIVGPLKGRFTNDRRTKELVRNLLIKLGCDAQKTYFDVPRIRIAPHSNYLTAGVSYAYKAHRDTWYSSPFSQVNYWLPVWPVTAQRAMAFYPGYWDGPVANSSDGFDYNEWVSVGRTQAVNQIKVDTRRHPLPLQAFSTAEEVRLCGDTGDTIVFSGAHLHATAPNKSDCTRFSIDFRTLHIEDLVNCSGAPNVDTRARGTTIGDFIRVADFAPISAEQNLRSVS